MSRSFGLSAGTWSVFFAAALAGALHSQEPRSARTTSTGPVLDGFAENRGQFDPSARFASRLGRTWCFVRDDGFVAAAADPSTGKGAAVFFTFVGAKSAGRRVVGEGERAARFNYFAGSDPAAWTTGVRIFERARVVDAFGSIDALIVSRDGRLAYDFELKPGARLSDVLVRVDGTGPLRVDEGGALVAETAAGPLVQSAPIAWRTGVDGASRSIRCAFRLVDDRTFGFESPEDDGVSETTIVDPTLDWCGYFGGSGLDEIFDVANDPTGAAYFAGRTGSPDFPTTPGAFDATQSVGNFDAVAAKIDPSGLSLVYATFFGGSGTDRIESIAADAFGNLTMTGLCDSGWPATVGAYDVAYGGQGDAFVTRLAPLGDALVFSTFVGGAQEDRGHALALDSSGASYVVGQTLSTTSFPTTPTSIVAGAGSAGTWNAFVAKIGPSGATLAYGARFGGSDVDWAYGVAVDALGAAHVVGATFSSNFQATAGALNLASGQLDVFAAKVNPAGTAFTWVSRFGGPGVDQAFGAALDADGALHVVGSAAAGFPTTAGAFRETGDGGDGFAAKLAADGTAFVYSTYVGGSGIDQAQALALDAFGRLYVVGYTSSAALGATPNAIDATYGGGGVFGDGFVMKLAPNGASAPYVSYFGGPGDDQISCASLAANGVLWIGGSTASTGLATGGALPAFGGGGLDGFGAKMTLPRSAGSVPFGSGWSFSGPIPTQTCGEPVFLTAPTIFGASAPPNANGFVLFTVEWAPLDVGFGLTLYGDYGAAIPIATPAADALGNWSAPFPFIPEIPTLEGLVFMIQTGFEDATSPFGVVSTNPVRLHFGY